MNCSLRLQVQHNYRWFSIRLWEWSLNEGAFFSMSHTSVLENGRWRFLNEEPRLGRAWWSLFLAFSTSIAVVIFGAGLVIHKWGSTAAGSQGDQSEIVISISYIICLVALGAAVVGVGMFWRKLAQILGHNGTSVGWWFLLLLLLFAAIALSTVAGRWPYWTIGFAGLEVCEAFIWQRIGSSRN